MTYARTLLLILLLSLSAGSRPVRGQESCQPPAALSIQAGPNIFTAQQEMDLGDVIAGHLQGQLPTTDASQVVAYLSAIGDRLLKHLPPTGLRFRYFLMDTRMPDALSLPGGRIYVSRKMIAYAGNEEEIAGVLAHEIGHAVTHQSATELSFLLRNVLGVTAVGNRDDISEKLDALRSNWQRNPQAFREVQKRGSADQQAADQIALYLLARAGYSPENYVAFFDRLAQTKGQTGTWITDFFHLTKPNEVRLRELLKATADMPQACIDGNAAGDKDAFLSWQAETIQFSDWTQARQEKLHGILARVTLDPPLRASPEIASLSFSSDGRYLLAKSFGKIYVLSREPFAYLFSIDARSAGEAHFTPDSASLVLSTSHLRVEVWDLAGQKRVNVYEPVVLQGCRKSVLSPDGHTLACGTGENVILLDVRSGETLFKKRLPVSDWLWSPALGFSPDARYFVAASHEKAVAFDITARSELPLQTNVQDAVSGRFVFLGPNRIVGTNIHDFRNSLLMDFPSGKVLETFQGGLGWLRAPTHGDYLLRETPSKEYKIEVVDLVEHKIRLRSKQRVCDIFDDTFATLTPDNAIGLYDARSLAPKARLALPDATFPRHLPSSVASPDLQWLAVSGMEQGGIWNLTTGKRVHELKPFYGGWFRGEEKLYATFSNFQGTPHVVAELSLPKPEATISLKLQDKHVRQEGPFLVISTPKTTGGVLAQDKDDLTGIIGGLARAFTPCRWQFPDFDPFNCDVTYEMREIVSGKILWSRRFPKESPQFRVLPDSKKVLLIWWARIGAAREEIRKYPELAKQFGTEKDLRNLRLLEVLDASNGKLLHVTLLDPGQDVWGMAENSAGKQLLILTHGDRVLLRSLPKKDEEGTIPGRPLALSRDGSLLAVANKEGEVAVYNLHTTKMLDDFNFVDSPVLTQFSEDGRRLLVLTDKQTAYILGVSPSPQASTASAAPQ